MGVTFLWYSTLICDSLYIENCKTTSWYGYGLVVLSHKHHSEMDINFGNKQNVYLGRESLHFYCAVSSRISETVENLFFRFCIDVS